MAVRREIAEGARKMARSHFGSLAVLEGVWKTWGESLCQGWKVMMEKTRKRARTEEKSGLSVKWETIMDQARVYVSWKSRACFRSLCEK